MFFSRKPYILYAVGDGKQTRVPISGETFVIGSGEACDLRIRAAGIAERHLQLERMSGKWVVRVEGISPVHVEGRLLRDRDRTIRSGETINLADVLNITFVDPAEDKASAASAANPAPQLDDEPKTSRLIVGLFATVVAGSFVFLFYWMAREPAVAATDYSSINVQSINGAVEDLPHCLEQAAGRLREGLARGDRDQKSPFWTLAAHLSEDSAAGGSEDVRALQRSVGTWLGEGMRAERRGDRAAARLAYEAVQGLVPDLKCSAHLLAAARHRSVAN